MKPPALLKSVLDILLILIILGLLLPLAFAIYHLLTSDQALPFTVNGQEIRDFNATTYIIIFFSYLADFIFLYIILRFRKLIALFFFNNVFTTQQINETNRIGFAMLISAVLNYVPIFVYKVFLEKSPRHVSYGPGNFDSFWFILALGLFFIYLSKIFNNAKALKEENDLTV